MKHKTDAVENMWEDPVETSAYVELLVPHMFLNPNFNKRLNKKTPKVVHYVKVSVTELELQSFTKLISQLASRW